jgi:hypothetical protein
VELPKGAYRLRCRSPHGDLEQIVATCDGWQTQIFAWAVAVPESPDLQVNFARASVLMSRRPFRSEDKMLRNADAARIALSRGRVVMPRQLLRTLLDEKFESPMLGLYAAEAIRARTMDSPSAQEGLSGDDQGLLQRVSQALLALVPDHPDVMALASILGLPRPLAVPPTLRTLWATLVERSLDQPGLFIPGSLAARIPSAVVDGTPWLIWLESALLPVQAAGPATAELHGIYKMIGALGDEDLADRLNLTGVEESLLFFLDRRAKLDSRRTTESKIELLDERSVARAFGTTVPDVESAVHGLAAKLRAGKLEF